MPRAYELDPQDFNTLQNAMSQLSSLAAMAPTFLAGMAAAKQVLSSLAEVDSAKEKAEKDLAELKKQIGVAEKASLSAKDLQSMAEHNLEATRRSLASLDDNYLAMKAQQENNLAQYRSSAREQMEMELAAAKEEAGKHLKLLTSEVKKLEERRDAAEAALKAIKASL